MHYSWILLLSQLNKTSQRWRKLVGPAAKRPKKRAELFVLPETQIPNLTWLGDCTAQNCYLVCSSPPAGTFSAPSPFLSNSSSPWRDRGLDCSLRHALSSLRDSVLFSCRFIYFRRLLHPTGPSATAKTLKCRTMLATNRCAHALLYLSETKS